MKKRRYLILLFIFLLATINIVGVTGEEITGEVVTGDASQLVNMNITVIGALPSLSIISPKNETYLTNTSLLLNYSSNGNITWYNIDNRANTTVTSSPVYFNTSQGSHILYLFANNSNGESTANVSFIANSTKFTILYDEYNGSTKGSSTDFILYTYEELQNLSDIVLEHSTHGKIRFNEAINSTNDQNIIDNLLDLDSHTNISSNRIELNSTALPNFNKQATIWIYNLALTTPRILIDGSVCSTCTQNSYSGGTLSFNVTGFTGVAIYSADETPVTPPPPPGGNGGVTPGVTKSFSIDKQEITVSLKQGETKREIIVIKNTGSAKLNLNLENPALKDLMKISEMEFSLNPGESKTINLDFIAREDTIPNLYIGKIIAKANGLEKEILVSIEVETKEVLFDVKVEIPKKYLYVLPGEELVAKVEVFNLGTAEHLNASIDYIIRDEDGKEILAEHETIAIEARVSLVKTFKMPEDIKFGRYILYVKVTYKQEVASASEWFNVGRKYFLTFRTILYLVGIIIDILFIIRYKKKKKEHPEPYSKSKKQQKPTEIQDSKKIPPKIPKIPKI